MNSERPYTHPTESSMDWCYRSVETMARAIREGRISSTELVERHFEHIQRVNTSLNAVVRLSKASALKAAHRADRMRNQGAKLGPLHGVPMTIKDSLDTSGVITTGGVKARMNRVPSQDATVVHRLKQAGAILLGKTNTPPLTLSFETNNAVYGRTHNPYDFERTCGGSSGGSAAIVAAGGSPFDIGSDTGGSIRQPCHNCGVVGIKPTSGRVPRTGHLIAYDNFLQSLTQLGPITRYVRDAQLLLPIISGPDWKDPHVIPMPWRDPDDVVLSDLRIAFYTNNGAVQARSDIAQVIQDAAYACEMQGASIHQTRPLSVQFAANYFDALFEADDFAWIRRLQDESMIRDDLWTPPKDAASLTLLFEHWQKYQSQMLQFMEQYDVILCPAFTHPAMPHGAVHAQKLGAGYGYLNAFNLVGWPVIVVRAGTSVEGLPIGIQIAAAPWREDIALAVAAYIEESFGGWEPPSNGHGSHISAV